MLELSSIWLHECMIGKPLSIEMIAILSHFILYWDEV